MIPRHLILISSLAPLALFAQPEPPPPPPAPQVWAMTLKSGGSFLGVGVKEIDAERAKALKLREEFGVEITHIEEGSPAEKAGLQKGDVVQHYQGQRVEGTEQFVRFVRETPVGRTVQLEVIRNGSPVRLSAVIGKRDKAMAPLPPNFSVPDINIAIPDIPKAMMSWRSSYLGIEGEALGTSQLASYFGVKEGVLVRAVTKGSAAEKAGIQAGDVITKAGGAAVAAPRDLSAALKTAQAAERDTFPVTIVREKREITLTVTLEPAPASPRRSRPVSRQE
jgi:serine protease Do